MNYMRILLIYMAAAMTLSVQSTSAPKETPTPAPAETAVVETAGIPAETTTIPTAAVTPAGASETPRPVPQITPNKKYRNLSRKDKGKEVRQLQERLIELGYLPEGSADGVYGNQTAKAVRSFQYYNELTQDGIAGKRTQTYLYENPDVNPYPTPTPEPTATPEPTPAPTPEEIPTATPTEAPTEVPTEAPTETPTEVPTEAPTEAPTEVPTEEPTEIPTEAPTEAPTEVPTETPTVAPTEAPTPERTAGAPVTKAPVTATPVAEPTMSVEEIDPGMFEFVQTEGSVTVNGELLRREGTEGGAAAQQPRLQKRDRKIRVSLDDLADFMDDWLLTDDGDNIILETKNHTLALMNEDAGVAATADASELAVESADFEFAEGHFISAEFLAKALGGEAEWDAEGKILKLLIP